MTSSKSCVPRRLRSSRNRSYFPLPLFYCERCGRYFTPTGRRVQKAITARGEFHDPEDSVCNECLSPVELRLPSGDLIINQGKPDERHFTA